MLGLWRRKSTCALERRPGPPPSCKFRAIVICARFKPGRSLTPARHFMQPVSGLQIASRLDPQKFDVQLYHEDWHGPFPPEAARGTHIVFLTGLQIEFDRMRQLACIFKRCGAVTVAGGSICSLFPEFAAGFFDVVCAGGMESVADVAEDFTAGTLKQVYRSGYLQPGPVRLDFSLLTRAGIRSPVHFLEGSRGCSFKCSFCVMPVEAGGHASYAVSEVRRSIDDAIAASPHFSLRRLWPHIVFVDNNFSDNRHHLEAMMAMLAAHPRVRGWSAMVTQNVLSDRGLLKQMAASKCRHLFVGLESLDAETLRRYNKKQNLGRQGVLPDVVFAEHAGISIGFGYLFDPRYQTPAEMERALRLVAGTAALPMPSFVSLIAPLAGTAAFWEDARLGRLAPGLRLRDLDGETIAYRNLAEELGPYPATVARILYRPWQITGRKTVFLKIARRLLRSGCADPVRWWTIIAANLHFMTRGRAYRSRRSTYVAGENVLDPQYGDQPADLTCEERARYFDPIAVTDAKGRLMPWLAAYAPADEPARSCEVA